jgi:hypothetical protein
MNEELKPVMNEIEFLFRMHSSEYVVKIYEVVIEAQKIHLIM